MAGKSDAFENDVLKLFFTATAIANLADNAVSSPLGNLYVALHTADPTDAGDQTSSEAAYTSYARVAVVRSGSGWTVSGNAVTNAATITFPACTGSTAACTHFSIGVAASSTSKILYSGELSATLNVSNGITPSFAAGELDGTED